MNIPERPHPDVVGNPKIVKKPKKLIILPKKPAATKKEVFARSLERFMKMKPSDLPPKKQPACQRDIKEIGFPKDTIRCADCGLLYERLKHKEHKNACKQLKTGLTYGCVKCNFKNSNLDEIRAHVTQAHKKKS